VFGHVRYSQSITDQTATQGSGPFQGGATTGTPYASFAPSYVAENGLDYEATSQLYTVQAGDTLESIAQELWGDADFWYLIGDANGFDDPDATLTPGQDLVIPNQVHNNQDNSTTYSVYNQSTAEGDLLPVPPKPVVTNGNAGGNGCGAIGEILETIVAVVVAAVIPGGGILLDAAIAAGTDALEQGIGLATGLQSKFDWDAVAESAIGGAVSGAIGVAGAVSGVAGALGPVGAGALEGVADSAVSQGLDLAAGLQSKFDWGDVAAAVVGGALSDGNSPSVAGLIAGAAAKTLVDGTDFGDNVLQALPSAIGQTIGNVIAGQIDESDDSATQAQSTPQPGQSSDQTFDGAAYGYNGQITPEDIAPMPLNPNDLINNVPSIDTASDGADADNTAVASNFVAGSANSSGGSSNGSSLVTYNSLIPQDGFASTLNQEQSALNALGPTGSLSDSNDFGDGANGYNGVGGRSAYYGISEALGATGTAVDIQAVGTDAFLVATSGEDAVAAMGSLEKFAFGPIGDVLLVGDQIAQIGGDIQSGVDPASAIAGHTINTGVIIGVGGVATAGGVVVGDALAGVEGGPWGMVAGAAFGVASEAGLSPYLPSGRWWSQQFKQLSNEPIFQK
jgi:LysM repeat protein